MKNISINNGLSKVSADELTESQVNDVFEQYFPAASDEARYAGEQASAKADDIEAKRLWIAAAALVDGEIVIG